MKTYQINPIYMKRIKSLHETKIHDNRKKIAVKGSINIDDHGYILHEDFHFESPYNKDEWVTGMKKIGKVFKAYFEQMPVYCHPSSALATCWVGYLQDEVKMGIVKEDRDPKLDQIFQQYHIIQPGFGAMNHLGPDVAIGLKLGWGGLLDKLKVYYDLNGPDCSEFFEGEILFVEGVRKWIKRHVTYVDSLADKCEEPTQKKHYETIRDMNQWLLQEPPRTFREACQFIAHFQAVDRTYYAGGALSQLDEILYPYYIKDIREGVLTDDEAIWILTSLFFHDTHYSQIGGLTMDGKRDRTNPVSHLILEAMHAIKIPVNIAIRVHDGIDPELMKKSIIYTMEDGTGVDYSLNIGCEEGYAKNGYPLQTGRMRAKVGCNWTALPGREYPLQDVSRCNMAVALNFALEELYLECDITMEQIWEAFVRHLKIMVDTIRKGYDLHYEVVSRNTPEIVLNLFMHGPVERGLNVAEGGVDNVSFCMDGIGLATVADSLAVIEKLVVIEGSLTWPTLVNALQNDFEDERLKALMTQQLKFGHPDSLSNKWAIQIRDTFVALSSVPTPKHHFKVIPGMFSHGDVYMYGEHTKATPNGRRNGEPISHSNEPDPGFSKGIHGFSPTLKASAVALTQPGLGNSSPLHLDIDRQLVQSSGGVKAIEALIHAHNHMGGTLINLNCLNEETLLKAHEDPESYPDLLVRVTGYSAFFASLSKDYRQQIIDRFLTT